MASKSRNSHEDPPHHAQQAPSQIPEPVRQQWVLATQVSCAMCRAAEAIQQVQHHSTQRATLRYQEMTEQVRGIQSPAEMLTIQSSLMTSNLQETAKYMQEMAQAMLRMQGMMLDQSHAKEGAKIASQAASAAMNAWQNAMGSANGRGHTAAHH